MGDELTDRLKRLLFVVPYVSRHPGRTVNEVAQAAGLSREALVEGLETLTLVGRPPFQPDDLLDIYVDDDDRVYVEFHQQLSAPPRLSPGEGAALAAAAALLRPVAGDPLFTALGKLESALPSESLAKYHTMRQALDTADGAVSGLTHLSTAIASTREVTFLYESPGKPAEPRRAQPFELISRHGQWYLSAHCLTRHDDRLFRVDRMREVVATATPFARPSSLPQANLTGTTAEQKVRVRFNPTAGPYVVERFGTHAQTMADGSVDVWVPGDSPRWLVSWVLSFGGDGVVQEPEWAITAVRQAAQELI